MILILIEIGSPDKSGSQGGVVEPPICREHQGFTSVETGCGLQFCTMIEEGVQSCHESRPARGADTPDARFSLDQFNFMAG
jgi:hypothetical protein